MQNGVASIHRKERGVCHGKLNHRGDPQVPSAESEGNVFCGRLLILIRMNAAIVFDQRLLIDMLLFCVRSVQREREPLQQLAF